MNSVQLRQQLDDLRKKEAIAQTREQLLLEDKNKLLQEIDTFFDQVRKLNIIPDEELTPENLSNIVIKLQDHIDIELQKSNIPVELL